MPAGQQPAPDSSGRTVLMVDDDPDVRTSVARGLRHSGFDVRVAATGKEALRLLSIDPHSPNEFRCNQIVRNIDVFYSTFNVSPGDALWLDPEDRVTIW